MAIVDSSWKDWFEPRILSRGYDYYRSGAVSDVSETEDGYEATVEGSEPYTVSVSIEDGELVDAECDCPYSEDGNYCKHEAALLYYLSSKKAKENKQEDSGHIDDVENVINNLDESQLRCLLLEAARKNKALRDELFARFSSGIPKQHIADLLDEAIGYIENIDLDEYFDAESSIDDLAFFIEDKIVPLLDKGTEEAAISSLAADIIDEIPLDDISDYGYEDSIGEIIDSLMDIIQESYGNAAEDDKKKIADDIRIRYKSAPDIYRSFIIDNLHDKDAARERIAELLAVDQPGWSYPAKELESIMTILDYSEDDVLSILRERISSPAIAQMLVDRLLDAGRWKDSIAEIEGMKAYIRSYNACRDKLKRIYTEHGMMSELAALIEKDILECHQYTLDNILELKSILPDEEWKNVYSKLKLATTLDTVKAKMYSHFKDYDALIDYVESKCDPVILLKYSEELVVLYPERVYAVFNKVLDQVEGYMANRQDYAWYASILKALAKTDEGRIRADVKAAEVKFRHPRHTALHDELGKAGF